MLKRHVSISEYHCNMNATERKQIEETLLEKARELYEQGPGWAQESVVLREVATQLRMAGDLNRQQALLDIWHRLFHQGQLCWGYDLDNPSHPFFHLGACDPALAASP
jgi:hypothetical protein